MEIKQAQRKHNQTITDEKWRIDISGFGLHSGEMIFIEGTDFHFGCPVDYSSNLCHDIAKDGQILVTQMIYEKALASK